MSKTLLEQLPEIVRAGKRQAERIMEGLEARTFPVFVYRLSRLQAVFNFEFKKAKEAEEKK